MAHGVFVDGVWHTEWYDAKATGGRFVPFEPVFRNWVTADGSPGPSGEGGFAAEPGRYHLYVSLACPYAHRTVIFRKLKKLEGAISMSILDPVMGDQGWEFSDGPGTIADMVNGKRRLGEIYLLADPRYTGRVSVPVLWDKKRRTIVNNELPEIIRMLNSAFASLTDDRADYYPAELRAAIDRINARVYNDVNIGVYRAGFATAQDVYEEGCRVVFAALDWIEDLLSRQRFLAGARLTEADWRLFTTLRALRRRLLQPLQMQPAPHRRLWQSGELPARPLSGARHRRHREHGSHQAALLHEHDGDQSDAHRAARAGTGFLRAARSRPLRKGGAARRTRRWISGQSLSGRASPIRKAATCRRRGRRCRRAALRTRCMRSCSSRNHSCRYAACGFCGT